MDKISLFIITREKCTAGSIREKSWKKFSHAYVTCETVKPPYSYFCVSH